MIAAFWLLIALVMAPVAPARAEPPSPVGTWHTFDDDGHATGAVTITEADGTLSGTITAIADPAKQAALCIACEGALKNHPVLGLRVIWGVVRDEDDWGGGKILDPNTGKIYSVKMHLKDAGQTLVLRGFLGISLFGRTQTWRRQ